MLTVTKGNGETLELTADMPPVEVVQKLLEIACNSGSEYADELNTFANRITVERDGELIYFDVTITRYHV